MNKYLVFGGAGSIGSELVRQLSKNNFVYFVDINETAYFDLQEELLLEGRSVWGRIGDVRDKHTVADAFREANPDVVFIASALKHVTPNEYYPREALLTNAMGTLNILEEAKRQDVQKLVYISTDKVINDYSVMGNTKRFGELVTKNFGYVSVRFGNVLGSRGSVLPIWEKQHKEGKPLTITDERMERYFMTIQQACELLIEASEKGEVGQIMIMDMGKPRKIIDLKKELYGDYPVKIIGTRPGEYLTERLMTDDEARKARKVGNFWILDA